MPNSHTHKNSPPPYVKQCGNFAIPGDTLKRAREILGAAITPSVNSSSANAVIEQPASNIETIKRELRLIGLTAKATGQRHCNPGTVEIAPLWQDYVTSLPRYRAGEKGAWKLARKRLAPDILAMNYNPLANSFTFELPKQRSIYMLSKTGQKEKKSGCPPPTWSCPPCPTRSKPPMATCWWAGWVWACTRAWFAGNRK